MTLIDQRILIPAPAQAVWQIIADHRLLPQWRSDVQTTSILTTRSDSRGTRRRITPRNSRKDIIEEITVWYDGVGYEYHIVDGSPYKSFFSRIRLQATPDGTIVQWTMTFELGNLLKRILQGRGHRRRLEKLAVESLRNLRRYVASKGITIDAQHREKTRIKEAPDADARAEYGAKIIATKTTDEIDEPPIRIEDTPSVPRVVPPSFLAEAMKDVAPPPLAEEPKEDTRPVQPITDEQLAAAQPPTETPPSTPVIPEPAVDPVSDTKPKAPVFAPRTETPAASSQDDDLPPPTDKRDTGQISIWEVFGLDRPKDELTKIIDDLKPPTPDGVDSAPKPTEAKASNSAREADHSMEPLAFQPKTLLDDWLAANEPPIPLSASGTMRTVARSSQQARGGLRRIQQQQRLKVRRPLQDEDNKKPPQD
ncbi:MAG: SRPBCC family protein [Anaerolineales bacterium]|nr:SRPBCC family protein [Anaerolineales bacterium]